MFAFSPLPRRWFASGRQRGVGRLVRRQRLAHQGHPLAVGRHHQERSFLGGVRNRKAVLEHLDIAGLLAVEILRRLDGDLQAEDRPQLPDRLGMSVVDHERPQPLLEQVRILASRQVELGVQGGGFDPVVAVAGPLDVDLAEDRQIGTLVGLIQPGKFLVRVRGGITGDGQGRTHVPGTGHVQERLEQPAADDQELPKEGLLDLMDRLMLVGGVLQAFDQVPERLEPLIDVRRARLLARGSTGDRT